MKALILVDIQNDFLPGGALAVKHGDRVVPVANEWMEKYRLVIATQDWHPANHQSFASQHPGKKPGQRIMLDEVEQVLWPDHCVQGTKGAQFAPGLNLDGIQHVIQKGTDPRFDSYSGFLDNDRQHATGLEALLREHNVTVVHIMGLATDYCVKATAIDSAQLGFETAVILEGIRGVELGLGDCAMAMEQMMAAGVEMIS
ncbi:bifunctional nicotinamidase/pyrazinamidase [Bremerella sp. JC817]|uniref:bifunctional nicotinamidase/pyrazinamidase n=1 Tax=Bremerella sp. JC817 TaxID=3231756 RepID=UPI003458751A